MSHFCEMKLPLKGLGGYNWPNLCCNPEQAKNMLTPKIHYYYQIIERKNMLKSGLLTCCHEIFLIRYCYFISFHKNQSRIPISSQTTLLDFRVQNDFLTSFCQHNVLITVSCITCVGVKWAENHCIQYVTSTDRCQVLRSLPELLYGLDVQFMISIFRHTELQLLNSISALRYILDVIFGGKEIW